MAQNRKKRKKRTRYGKGLIYSVLLLAGGALLMAAGNDVYTCLQLKQEIAKNEILLRETQQTQEELETTRKNLTNPDYLEFVARGKFHVSRYGEQVFVFPALDDEENSSSSSSDSSKAEDSSSAQSGSEGLASSDQP